MVSPFPARMFRGAAIYGIVTLPPLYLLPLPHEQPETRLGFIGVALAFQVVFWIIAGDPVRYRPLMLPAVLEKLAFALPVCALVALGRTPPLLLVFAGVDLIMAAGFMLARARTPR